MPRGTPPADTGRARSTRNPAGSARTTKLETTLVTDRRPGLTMVSTSAAATADTANRWATRQPRAIGRLDLASVNFRMDFRRTSQRATPIATHMARCHIVWQLGKTISRTLVVSEPAHRPTKAATSRRLGAEGTARLKAHAVHQRTGVRRRIAEAGARRRIAEVTPFRQGQIVKWTSPQNSSR